MGVKGVCGVKPGGMERVSGRGKSVYFCVSCWQLGFSVGYNMVEVDL